MKNVIVNLALEYLKDDMKPVMPIICWNDKCERLPVSLKTEMLGVQVCDDYWVMRDDDNFYHLYREGRAENYCEEDLILNKLKELCASGEITKMPEVLPEEIALIHFEKVNELTSDDCRMICDYLKLKAELNIAYHEEEKSIFSEFYNFVDKIEKYV